MLTSERHLADRFDLCLHYFRHGDFDASLIAPREPDALIDTSEFNVDERLPYWAELWPSARALAAELLDRPPPSGRVIELGCGIALPSLVLRSRGAEVVASDYFLEALDFAKANSRRNGIDFLETRLLDWRDPPADLGRFDLIVAADVLYELRNAIALAALIPTLLAPGGEALIADPGRRYVDDLIGLLGKRGFRMTEVRRRSEASPAGGPPTSIRLHSIRAPRRRKRR